MSFWDRLFGRQGVTSREIAKERLQVVLVYDRARIAPGLLETLKDEIISGISKHIEVDKRHVELSLADDDGRSRLVADIPLKPIRRNGGDRGV
ncbi:MAG: cell division topological specificity factor MinE [Anaerolineae bacterium]